MAKEEIFFGINIDTGKAIKDFGTLKDRTKALKKELDGTKVGTKRFKELQTEITKNQGTIRRFNRELRETKSLATRVGQGVTTAFKNVGVALAGAFAVGGLFNAIRDGIGTIKDFEQAIADVGAVSGASSRELGMLSKSARDLGKSSIFTAEQVAGLQLELAKLGFTTEQIIDASGGILDLSTAFRIDLSQAAEVSASTLRAFNLEASDMTRVTDLMADSFASSGLDVTKFQEAMKNVAPTAVSTGRSLEETTALLSVLANNGVSGSIAGTRLSRVFIELDKKGISLEEAMNRVTNSTSKLGTATELVKDRGALALQVLAAQSDQLKILRKDYSDTAGSAAELARKSGDTLTGSVRRLASAWDEFVLSLAESDSFLANILRGVVDLTNNFISFITPANRASDALSKQRVELNLLVNRITDVNIKEEDRLKLIEELNSVYPGYLDNLDAEKVTNEQLANRLAEVNQELINKIALQLKDEELTEKLTEAAERQNKVFEREEKIRTKLIDLNEEFGLGINFVNTSLEEQVKQAKEGLNAQTKIEKRSKVAIETVNKQGEANNELSDSLRSLKSAQEDLNESTEEASRIQKQRRDLVQSLFGGVDPTTPTAPEATELPTTTEDSAATVYTAEELEKQRLLLLEHRRLRATILLEGEALELELLEIEFEKKKNKLAETGLTELEIQEALERGKLDIKTKYDNEEIKAEESKQKKLQSYRDAEDKYNKEQLKKRQDEADRLRDINNERLESVANLVGSTVQLLSRDEESRKKNAKLIKAFAIAEIAINTQKALMNVEVNEKSPLFLPNLFTGGLAGLTIGTVQKIAIAAQGAASIAAVASQKFAKGGILSGPSHASGGIKTNLGELEGGEAVINKKSTAMFGGALSAINEAGGGKKFARGGVLPTPNTITTPNNINKDILKALTNLNLSPTVSVVEINEAQTRISEIENNSTL